MSGQRGYEGLNQAQWRWLRHLLEEERPSQWPEGLRQHIDTCAPRSWEQIVDAVGTWIKQQND